MGNKFHVRIRMEEIFAEIKFLRYEMTAVRTRYNICLTSRMERGSDKAHNMYDRLERKYDRLKVEQEMLAGE